VLFGWVKPDYLGPIPFTGWTVIPPIRFCKLSRLLKLFAILQNKLVLAAVPLSWRNKLNSAVVMLIVVTANKRMTAMSGFFDVSTELCRSNRAVFQDSKQRFGVWVIVTDRLSTKG